MSMTDKLGEIVGSLPGGRLLSRGVADKLAKFVGTPDVGSPVPRSTQPGLDLRPRQKVTTVSRVVVNPARRT